jgi:hypothetical protein
MSQFPTGGAEHTSPRRRIAAVLAGVAGVVLIGGGGALLTPQAPSVPAARVPLVGRTTLICTPTVPADTTPSASPGPSDSSSPADSPSPSAEPSSPSPSPNAATTTVSAVTVTQPGGRTGTLTVTPLGSPKAALTVEQPGKGDQLSDAGTPVVLAGDGAMATSSSGALLSIGSQGTDAGLASAPCLTPATAHWFSGLGATDTDRTDLVLTNPDDTQAEVDLRFYGRDGRVVVPGSPGLVVQAHSSRTVSLTSLVHAQGPLGLAIQASEGRVAAVARRSRTTGLTPAGVDWQVPSSSPSTTTLIPSVPGDEGGRELVVTNPTASRTAVTVEVLGLQGPYAPAGADSMELPAESSATVDLAPGLAGEAGSIRLTSDQPVTGAVISTSQRTGARADLAVQSAAVPLVRTGVSALATADSVDAELSLSNGGPTDTPVTFEVLSLDGVVLRSDDILLTPGTTATRRLNSPAPSYVVVRVPAGSAVVGGVVLTQPDGNIAGLATIPLTSPDLASRAPSTRPDPAVGR